MKPGELPAAKVARAIYSGPYEGLPSAWGEFDRWIKANGYEPADDLWELYSVGPQSTARSGELAHGAQSAAKSLTLKHAHFRRMGSGGVPFV